MDFEPWFNEMMDEFTEFAEAAGFDFSKNKDELSVDSYNETTEESLEE